MTKLRKTSPRRMMNPPLANAIRGGMNKLRKTSPPRRTMNQSLADDIRGGMNKLRKTSPPRRALKPSILDEIKRTNKTKLRKVSSPKKLTVVNNNYNEFLNKLASRRKRVSSGSNNDDEWE